MDPPVIICKGRAPEYGIHSFLSELPLPSKTPPPLVCSVMMHLHLLKPQTQYMSGGGAPSSSAAGAQRCGGASGKGHEGVILVYSVPTKQVGFGAGEMKGRLLYNLS